MLLSYGYQLSVRFFRQGYLASNVHDKVSVQLECICLDREKCHPPTHEFFTNPLIAFLMVRPLFRRIKHHSCA